jgi:hypothetical protein
VRTVNGFRRFHRCGAADHESGLRAAAIGELRVPHSPAGRRCGGGRRAPPAPAGHVELLVGVEPTASRSELTGGALDHERIELTGGVALHVVLAGGRASPRCACVDGVAGAP